MESNVKLYAPSELTVLHLEHIINRSRARWRYAEYVILEATYLL